MTRRILCLALVATLTVMCGLGSQNGALWAQEQKDVSGKLQIKGSDTMVNLGQAWAEAFMKKYPKSKLSVTGGGSGTGIAALINSTCDVCQSSRAMTDKEKSQAGDVGIKPVETIVALDGIAVVVNPSNPVSQVTMEQLADIFTGKVTNWKSVGGEDKEITLLSREANSGTHVFFKEHVLRKGVSSGKEEYAPSALLMPSSQAIADEAAQNQSAIGYYGLGYISARQKVVAVGKTKAGPFVSANPKTVKDNSYPVSRPLFIYTPGQPKGLTKIFIDWVLSSEGQSIVRKLEFVSLEKDPEVPPMGGVLQIKGSDTMVNLGQAWAEAYMKKNSQAKVAVVGGGSGTGIAALINGTCDIAQCSRMMKDKEKSQVAEKGHKAVEIIVGLDGLAVVVNLSNPVSQLNVDQLADIFTGRVTNWKDVGGPDMEITILSRESNSGTHVYFKEHVLNKGNDKGKEEFAPSALLMPSSQAIADEVAQNKTAIGYYGLGYVSAKQKPIAVSQKKAGPFVLPSIKTVKDNTYPISRPLFMYTAGEATGLAKSFLDFVLSNDGQEIVRKLDFVPLN